MHSCYVLVTSLLTSVVADSTLGSGSETLRDLIPKLDFRTAQIEWTLTHVGGFDKGLAQRHVTHIANADILEFNSGDAAGLQEYRFRSYPPDWLFMSHEERAKLSPEELNEYAFPREKDAGTRSSMLLEGQAWKLDSVEFPLVGSVGPRERSDVQIPIDFSIIGFAPAHRLEAANPLGLEKHDYEGFVSARFETGFEDARRTVTAAWGENRIVWSFDDRRGRQPIKARFVGAQGTVEFSETVLQHLDGKWIPESVRFYRETADAPYRILEVSKATFDQPWHKKEITHDDLGAVFGTYFSTPDGQTGGMNWDGTSLISDHEFFDLVYGFGLLPDQKILEYWAKNTGKTVDQYIKDRFQGNHAAVVRRWLQENHVEAHGEEPPWITLKNSKEKDPWDLYVDEFLKKHELPQPGVERAKKLLEEAKKLRDANRHRVRKAEREGDRKTIERYKEREERIYRERLVDPLDQLAATIVKENRDRQDKAPD